jgi:hypothetical protein
MLVMFLRWMPEWIGPAAYLAVLSACALIAIGGVQFFSDEKANAGIKASQLAQSTAPRVQRAKRAIQDTPETAPELSPLYPTPRYSVSAGSQAELARKLAREGSKTRARPTARGESAFAAGDQVETTGFSYTTHPSSRFLKPEPSQ